jgi:hypothetical protein
VLTAVTSHDLACARAPPRVRPSNFVPHSGLRVARNTAWRPPFSAKDPIKGTLLSIRHFFMGASCPPPCSPAYLTVASARPSCHAASFSAQTGIDRCARASLGTGCHGLTVKELVAPQPACARAPPLAPMQPDSAVFHPADARHAQDSGWRVQACNAAWCPPFSAKDPLLVLGRVTGT